MEERSAICLAERFFVRNRRRCLQPNLQENDKNNSKRRSSIQFQSEHCNDRTSFYIQSTAGTYFTTIVLAEPSGNKICSMSIPPYVLINLLHQSVRYTIPSIYLHAQTCDGCGVKSAIHID
jgi:hypothetical protein